MICLLPKELVYSIFDFTDEEILILIIPFVSSYLRKLIVVDEYWKYNTGVDYTNCFASKMEIFEYML